jgi:hypothetical protein
VGSTISGSIEASNSRQGVEINDFEQAYASMLPRFLSNSSPKIVINGKRRSDTSTFDDSITTVLAGSKVSIAPNHERENRDLGMPSTHHGDTPFHEIGKLEPVSYIQNDELYALYPIILDEVSPVDPGTIDGAIEPFPIRSTAARQSTESSVMSRRVRGGISGHHDDVFGYSIPIEQKVYLMSSGGPTRPFQEYGVESLVSIRQISYFSDDRSEADPFLEDKIRKIRDTVKVDDEIFEVLLDMGDGFDSLITGYRSSTAGYTFNDKTNGTDSIVFADRRGA